MLQSDLSMYVSKKFLHYGLLQDDDVDVMAYYLENIISSGLVVFSVIGIAFFPWTWCQMRHPTLLD